MSLEEHPLQSTALTPFRTQEDNTETITINVFPTRSCTMQAIGFATAERLHALPKDQDVRAIACQLCPLGHDLKACLRRAQSI